MDGFRLKEAIQLALPKEHGSWSLALEPIALGLLAAPSWAGMPLALAAAAGFFLRRPVKILLQTKPDPRRSLAMICAGALLFIAAAGLLLALELGGVTRLWPLIPAAVAGSLFAWFDARGANREGAAEIAGTTAFALLPATFASLAGWPVANSLALAAVMLARSVPTVMAVRTFVRRRKGGAGSLVPAWLAALAANGVLGGLALWALVPWAVVAFSVLLTARAFWFGSPAATRWPARRLGYMELIMGVALVIVAAATWWR